MSVALLVVAYLLQQRCSPFVSTASLSEGLNLSQEVLAARLSDNADSAKHAPAGPSRAKGPSRASSSRAVSGRAGTAGSGIGGASGGQGSPAPDGSAASEGGGSRAAGGGATCASGGESSPASMCVCVPSSSLPLLWVPSLPMQLSGARDADEQRTRCHRVFFPFHSHVVRLWVWRHMDAGAASAGSSPTVTTSAVVSRRHQAFSLAAAALRIASLRIDYNTLECAFLITSVMVLMTGMFFASHGFPVGSVGYLLLNIVAAAFIVGSTLVFLLLLGFEVYRSIKFAAVHEVARQVEEEAVEVCLRACVDTPSPLLPSHSPPCSHPPVSLLPTVRVATSARTHRWIRADVLTAVWCEVRCVCMLEKALCSAHRAVLVLVLGPDVHCRLPCLNGPVAPAALEGRPLYPSSAVAPASQQGSWVAWVPVPTVPTLEPVPAAGLVVRTRCP
jgi:hypothetical protein